MNEPIQHMIYFLTSQTTPGRKKSISMMADDDHDDGNAPVETPAKTVVVDASMTTTTTATAKTDECGGGCDDGGEKKKGGGRRAEVKSLTVRFDGRSEVWRAPPTYGGADFDWPDGWIEVQRRRAPAPRCSLQGMMPSSSSSSTSSPSPPTPKKGGKKEGKGEGGWMREFHPPSPGRAACRSIEEVAAYIEGRRKKREEAEETKKRKMERRRRRSGEMEDGRRPSRPRTSAAASDLLPSSRELLPPPRMGTSAELNGIMKNDNAKSERMRTSILIGAILATRVGGGGGSLDCDRPFLGSNGRTYPDLRLAFGKHSKTRQCSLCKMRVQGSWYCRVGHGHLDRPDHDGGNSASILAELSHLSTDELERRLRGLTMTSSLSCPRVAAGGGSGFDGTGWSMDDIGNDLLYHVASFLPSLSDLSSLCTTSRRARRLLLGRRSEDLLRGVFLRAFGVGASRGWETLERMDMSWRDLWVTIRGLRGGLKRGSIAPPPPPPDDGLLLRDTIGVLPEHDEGEAIYYDNPSHADPDAAYCNGYFGMGALRLPPPPNAGPDWRPPIILRGDFDGIRILKSSSSLSRRRDETLIGGGPGLDGDMCVVGDEEGGGQVLSLIHCDPSSMRSGGGRLDPPCCFIGYASGRVAAVSATLAPGGDVYAFAISGSHHAHEAEVTALAFVDCGSSPRDGSAPVLFSACCAGKVYFYPHAFDPYENFSMERSVLAFSNYYDCPIFSMASTSMESHGHFYSVICTGDRDGNIRLWLKLDDDLVGLCTRAESQKFRHVQLCKSSTVSGTGFHLVTRAFFVRDNLLITGTNNGDVRFWQMQVAENASRAIGRGPLPALTLRYDLMGIHNGAVELLTVVGDVLLSSGGNDGKIVGWDISTGLRLGTIRCHPGRRLEDGGGTIRSCVVDLLLFGKEGSLISLCRDGSLKLFKM